MIKGDRVLLRSLRREDMHIQWRSENDPELFFLDGGTPRPTSLEWLYAHFDHNVSHPDPNSVAFAIEADGNYIGHCGLHNIQATARTCELGIEIGNKDYWGKGYGREVVRLLLIYAFEQRNLNRVSLQTHSENERALRCYRACGFIEEGRFRQKLWLNGHYVDGIAMGILRDEFAF
ncbi:MAG: GNAT family N-acetyltransferase [Anaerolineae bacterium]|nr:GNAT family N-acetyltransferase [Anaerolineae bacterium]